MLTVSDVTIIGGGVIGLLVARECLLNGATVTVVDKGDMGQESSWAGGGILLPLYPWRQAEAISRLVIYSHQRYPALIEELHTQSGIDPELLDSGLFITKNPDATAAKAWCADNSIAYSTPPESLVHSLATTLLNPLWLPEIRQVRNPRLLQATVAYLKQKGVHFISNCEVLGLQLHPQQSQVQTLVTSTGHYPVKQLILTTGAWTGRLWRRFFALEGCPPPVISPVKGQMLLFDTPPGTLDAIVLDDDHYLIPRQDGKVLAGSTVEHAEFDKQTDAVTASALTGFARHLLPALKACPVIKHWAGLRSGTPQGIPYIDLHPEFENVALCAGHYRNGLAMAPASAELLLDLLLQRKPRLAPEPYQLYSNH